jgi:hypothetical protein
MTMQCGEISHKRSTDVERSVYKMQSIRIYTTLYAHVGISQSRSAASLPD